MGRKVVFIGVSDSLLFILLLELRECADSLRKLGNMVAWDETATLGPTKEILSGRTVPKPLVVQYVISACVFALPRFGPLLSG
jgi:hypothetical protein